MSEENAEQTFEDAFDELAGDATPEAAFEVEATLDESGEADVQLREGEKEEEVEAEGQVDQPTEDDPEPQGASEIDALRQELQRERHKYNSDLGRQNAFQRQLK